METNTERRTRRWTGGGDEPGLSAAGGISRARHHSDSNHFRLGLFALQNCSTDGQWPEVAVIRTSLLV